MLPSVVLRNDGEINAFAMQELSKLSETLCHVWAITNRLYIEMHGPIID